MTCLQKNNIILFPNYGNNSRTQINNQLLISENLNTNKIHNKEVLITHHHFHWRCFVMSKQSKTAILNISSNLDHPKSD